LGEFHSSAHVLLIAKCKKKLGRSRSIRLNTDSGFSYSHTVPRTVVCHCHLIILRLSTPASMHSSYSNKWTIPEQQRSKRPLYLRTILKLIMAYLTSFYQIRALSRVK